MTARIESAYTAARDRYAEAGVDTDAALRRLAAVPISLHCWQGDDVGGFENSAPASAAASPSPAIIPARPARLTNCAPTRRWRSR